MIKKTKLSIRSSARPSANTPIRPDLEKTPDYEFCHEIVREIADRVTLSFWDKHRTDQDRKLKSEVCELFESANVTMLAYFDLDQVHFKEVAIGQLSLEESEPVNLDRDNYNRKAMDNTKPPQPIRSANLLWGKGLNKVKSAGMISKMTQRSSTHSRAAIPAKTFLFVDFSNANVTEFDSLEQQARQQKGQNLARPKPLRRRQKVSS